MKGSQSYCGYRVITSQEYVSAFILPSAEYNSSNRRIHEERDEDHLRVPWYITRAMPRYPYSMFGSSAGLSQI